MVPKKRLRRAPRAGWEQRLLGQLTCGPSAPGRRVSRCRCSADPPSRPPAPPHWCVAGTPGRSWFFHQNLQGKMTGEKKAIKNKRTGAIHNEGGKLGGRGGGITRTLGQERGSAMPGSSVQHGVVLGGKLTWHPSWLCLLLAVWSALDFLSLRLLICNMELRIPASQGHARNPVS